MSSPRANDSPASLGIDLGTSSAKAVVVNTRGELLAQATAEYGVRSVKPGWAESDPDDWWQGVGEAVREAVERSGVRPGSIGLAGQMHGLVLADPTGVPLRNAMLWADSRASAQLGAYERLGPAARERRANPMTPGMAGPMLCWVAEHEPGLYARSRWAFQPKDWLRYRLTNRAFSEPSDASATLLYDVPGDEWDADTIERLGLRTDLLAPLLDSSLALAGELGNIGASHLGLAPGTPVAAGAADTAAAIIGTGLSRIGEVQLTIGTGAQLVTLSNMVLDAQDLGVHCYRTAQSAGWYLMAATLNAGLALNWIRDVMEVSWADLYAAASHSPRPDEPIFIPYLVGERTPILKSTIRGAWVGLSLSADRESMLYAALEGVALSIRDALDALPGGSQADHLRLAGGGTGDGAWRQLLANVLGRPLDSVTSLGASGRGAALIGAVASGIVNVDDIAGSLAPGVARVAEPESKTARAIDQRRANFIEARQALM